VIRCLLRRNTAIPTEPFVFSLEVFFARIDIIIRPFVVSLPVPFQVEFDVTESVVQALASGLSNPQLTLVLTSLDQWISFSSRDDSNRKSTHPMLLIQGLG
jgi:hypothetical protein